MSLAKYHAKRNFAKTPEPQGKERKSQGKLAFVVQEHQATAHHYDFRLELDGVLKSWAVPKGPSLNPHDRHLAIQTEDHPFAYRTFEGTIPQGNYGAGEVIIWDAGTYEPLNHGGEQELRQGYKKGHITFFLYGKKLHGEFALIKLRSGKDDDAWLLIKKGDDQASSVDVTKNNTSIVSGKRITDLADAPDIAELPKTKPLTAITPMLCTLVDEPFSRDGWVFELKWDGYRAIASKHGGDVELYSRNALDFRQKYPLITEALHSVKDDVVLDGEVVAVDKDGHPHFEWLQNWTTQPQGTLHYYAFDILWINGHDVRALPLVQRKKLLQSVIRKNSALRYSDHVETDGTSLFTLAQKQGLEGIVAKKADSPYSVGVRGQSWLKIKTHLRQEAIICGYTEPRGTRRYIGSLVLGVYKKGELIYVGHSGGGIPTDQLKTLHQRLSKRKRATSPFAVPIPKGDTPTHWVKPQVICEVSFSEWTKEGIMRQPKFEGLRPDKSATNVHKETPKETTKIDKDHVLLPGSKVAFSHLDKVFWPELGYTKGDLIAYYQSVADIILPYLKDRPQSLLRQPHGYAGEKFFQKDMTQKLPPYADHVTLHADSTDEDVHFLVCNNTDTLLYMVQLGCIEVNPWSSRRKHLDNPDWAVIDLDPEAVVFKEVVQVARTVHQVCIEWHIDHYAKTSGKTGIHIFIPLGAKYSYDQARQFAQLIAIETNKRVPKITSIERSPSERQGKVYLDYLQNSRGQTLAAPYSVRPTRDASVSMPLHWDEVTSSLKPSDFTIKNAVKRIQSVGDLWKPVFGKGVDLRGILKAIDVA